MSTATPSRPIRPASARLPATPARPDRARSFAANVDPLKVLRQHSLGVIASAVFGAAVGTGGYFLLAEYYPLFRSEVLFEVQAGLQQPSDVGITDISKEDLVSRIAQTETYTLTSREVIGRAMNDPDIMRTNWHRRFMETGTFNHQEAVDELEEDLKTLFVRGSNLFTLSWKWHYPDDVPTVLNAVANAYIRFRKERDTSVYNDNVRVFRTQLDTTQKAIEDLTLEMSRLIKEKRFTTITDPQNSAEAYRMRQITDQLQTAHRDLSLVQTDYELNQNKLAGTVEPSAVDLLEAERDPAVMEQISRIQYLKTQLRRLHQTHQPDTLPVTQLESQIQAEEDQRDSKIQEIIRRNLDARLRSLNDQIERLRNSISEMESEWDKNNALLQDLADGQSQLQVMQVRQENLEAQRQAQLELLGQIELMRTRKDAERVRITQSALTPRELDFPRAQLIIPLCVLLLVGLTVGLVFVRELMDQRVKSASDLAVLPGAIVLGSIPDLDDEPTKTPAAELVVRRNPTSVMAESYRQAATSLFPLMERNGHQTLLLVGGLPGSGTTTVATNLAAVAAASGRKVLLIDANFRRPRLAEALGVSENGAGLGDLLDNAAKLEETIVDAGDGISLLPAGTPANRVFERLSNGSFDSLMAELRSRFDLIVFDAPPVVVAGDAMVLANKVDAAVLVVRANQEHRGLVVRMINRLAECPCELLGVLLNRPREVSGGYYRKNYAAMARYSTDGAV